MARSLGALDTTWGQVTADLLLVLLVAFNAYMGWRHGTLRRVLAFGGVYLGAFAATNIGNGLADLLHPQCLWNPLSNLQNKGITSTLLMMSSSTRREIVWFFVASKEQFGSSI